MADRDGARAHAAHEPDAPRLGGIAIGAAAIVAMVLLALGLALLIGHRENSPSPPPLSADAVAPTVSGAPALQAAPGQDITAFRQDKGRLLHEYAWVDRTRGVVRIPIERAMELLVQREGRAGR